MADSPWNNRTLTKGQIVQRLESLGCLHTEDHIPGSAIWKAPSGKFFSISYTGCDAAYLEGVVAQIEAWVSQE